MWFSLIESAKLGNWDSNQRMLDSNLSHAEQDEQATELWYTLVNQIIIYIYIRIYIYTYYIYIYNIHIIIYRKVKQTETIMNHMVKMCIWTKRRVILFLSHEIFRFTYAPSSPTLWAGGRPEDLPGLNEINLLANKAGPTVAAWEEQPPIFTDVYVAALEINKLVSRPWKNLYV